MYNWDWNGNLKILLKFLGRCNILFFGVIYNDFIINGEWVSRKVIYVLCFDFNSLI